MTIPIEPLQQLLSESRTIAVVGLSTNPERASHEVASYLQANGYRIIPVNPAYAGTHVLSELCYATLKQAHDALYEKGIAIDIVDCFRKPEFMPSIAQEAVDIRARVLWMQLGIINEEAAELARKAGLTVVMDKCLKVEHGRLKAQYPW